MKKVIFIIVLSVLLLALVSCSKTETKDTNVESDIYATVNGEEISLSEYDFFKNRLKNKILTEYTEKYDIKDFSSFWDNIYDGNSPKEELEERTLESCVEAKLVLVLCRENGIYQDISWAGLKSLAEEYNKEHKDTNSVGLSSIDMDSFYTYYVENGKLELENRIEYFEDYLAETVKNAKVERKN